MEWEEERGRDGERGREGEGEMGRERERWGRREGEGEKHTSLYSRISTATSSYILYTHIHACADTVYVLYIRRYSIRK